MKVINKVDLRLDDFEKCSLICDNDCPLGVLYDYACALKSFILQKIKENESISEQVVEKVPEEEAVEPKVE